MAKNNLYKNSGVDVHAGYETVSKIKKHIKKTETIGTINSVGNFGGLFDLTKLNIKNPVLVSGTDGVGTKLILAIEADNHKYIGQDLVAMCVNDIVTQGAKPLFFLDYFATGKLDPNMVEVVVKGICDALEQCDASLLGGETAEMPGVYDEKHYDLAGFTVGVVEKDKIINGVEDVKENDVLIAMKSSGIHSNGFSLVRKVIKDNNIKLSDKLPYNDSKTFEEELLTPTKLYVSSILDLISKVKVNGISHITGGGFYENVPRMMSDELTFDIDFAKIEVLPIFKFLQDVLKADSEEMFSTFNMGVGMVLAVNEKNVAETIKVLKENNEEAYVIGKVVKK